MHVFIQRWLAFWNLKLKYIRIFVDSVNTQQVHSLSDCTHRCKWKILHNKYLSLLFMRNVLKEILHGKLEGTSNAASLYWKLLHSLQHFRWSLRIYPLLISTHGHGLLLLRIEFLLFSSLDPFFKQFQFLLNIFKAFRLNTEQSTLPHKDTKTFPKKVPPQ